MVMSAIRSTTQCSATSSTLGLDIMPDACAVCAKYRLRMKDPNMMEAEKRVEAATFILQVTNTCIL